MLMKNKKKEKKEKMNKQLLSHCAAKVNKARRLKMITPQTKQMALVFQGTTKTCFSSQVRSSLICWNLFVL